MNKFLLCYFSATSNSLMVSNLIKENLEKNNCSINLYNIESRSFFYDLNDFDCLILVYPIHAFNAPKIVLDFLKSLKKTNIKCVVFKVSGEPLSLNNASLYKVNSILKKKHIKLVSDYLYVMPYHIIFRHSNEMVKRMFNVTNKLIPIDISNLLNGKYNKTKRGLLGREISFILRIEQFGAKIIGKGFKVNESCINCNRCILSCPNLNISNVNGKINFGRNCMICMRCVSNCPKDAINAGLLNNWKVNGSYSFDSNLLNKTNEGPTSKKHSNYLKRTYRKYFNKAEERIKEASKL